MINGTPQEMGSRASASSPSSQCSRLDDGRSGRAAAIGARAPAQRDALHVGLGVGAVRAASTRCASGYATGTLGLLYETLFRYDPLKDKYMPWLATDGKWVGRTYVMTLAARA